MSDKQLGFQIKACHTNGWYLDMREDNCFILILKQRCFEMLPESPMAPHPFRVHSRFQLK